MAEICRFENFRNFRVLPPELPQNGGYEDALYISGLVSFSATIPPKISFLGGRAHFVTYDSDDGDGQAYDYNAVT